MYVCVCKGITDSQIKEAVYDGATSLRDVRKKLNVASQCGRCGTFTRQVINETLNTHNMQSSAENLFYAAS